MYHVYPTYQHDHIYLQQTNGGGERKLHTNMDYKAC